MVSVVRIIAAIVAATCSLIATAADNPELQGSERVLETFAVGDSVVVRALRVEEANNTLWVGTSTGVHEVDMKTSALRNTFTREQGLANEYVFAVDVDNEGYTWFGTNAGGAYAIRTANGKLISPCTAWPTTGFMPLPMIARVACG